MPSRKQRRRRTKDRRHDYEYVFVDDEGNEVDADDVPQPSRNGTGGGKGSGKKDAPLKVSGGRTVKPATWQRATRRGLIFTPIIFGFVYLLYGSKLGIAGVVFQTVVLLAFFIPFGYLMDRMMYRTFVKRQASARAAKAKPR